MKLKDINNYLQFDAKVYIIKLNICAKFDNLGQCFAFKKR